MRSAPHDVLWIDGRRTSVGQVLAEHKRFREALELIAEASDIRDAVPEVRQIAREALQPFAAPEPCEHDWHQYGDERPRCSRCLQPFAAEVVVADGG